MHTMLAQYISRIVYGFSASVKEPKPQSRIVSDSVMKNPHSPVAKEKAD